MRALRSGRRGAKYGAPEETTFQRIFAVFPPDLFEQILHQLQEGCRTVVPAKPSSPVKSAPPAKLDSTAFDGKSQRGSFPTKDQKLRPMMVNAMDLGTGRVIGTGITTPSSNEFPAALHNNPETVRQIYQRNGAQYLLPVKENQSALLKRVQGEFDDPPIRPESQPIQKIPATKRVGDLSPLGPAHPDASRPSTAASESTTARTRRQVRHRRK